jgi:SOS-response transcriptional repressor LexA
LRFVAASANTEDRENWALPGFVDEPPNEERFTRLVPFTASKLLQVFGGWRRHQRKSAGPRPLEQTKIKPGMFIARVRGHSMEPKIRDRSWNLFRRCPQGSREGRILLVQFNSRGDLENGGRFTVKKYHSAKSVTEGGWKHEQIELLPLNPDYYPILFQPHEGPEMVVVGECVSSID